MLFSLNFVKIMGIFVRCLQPINKSDSTAFLYQIVGILLLLSTTLNFWYLSKDSVLTVPKTYMVLSNGICLSLCQ